MQENKPRLFIPGPTNLSKRTLEIGGEQYGYFRDEEFTKLNLRNEYRLKKIADCDGKVIPLTCSGTGAMEAVLLNMVSDANRILVINGGPFGQRWYDMCKFFGYNNIINFDAGFGKDIDLAELDRTLEKENIDTILCQSNETPSGQLYDIEEIGKLSKKHSCILIVDAIGSFMADEFKMKSWNVDVAVVSTQKALQLPSGMAYVFLSDRVRCSANSRSYYFNFNLYLDDYQLGRGHTPFTPNVPLIMQMNQKLTEIMKMGVDKKIEQMHTKAINFRNLCQKLPLKMIAETPSNLETGYLITDDNFDAQNLYAFLKKENVFIWRSGKQMERWLDDPLRRHIIIAHNGCNDEDHNLLVELMREYFYG